MSEELPEDLTLIEYPDIPEEFSDVEEDDDEDTADEIVDSDDSDLDDILSDSPLEGETETKVSMNDSDEETDDEEIDDKINVFEDAVRIQLLDQHNECNHSNYKEIQALSNVTRDKHNNIIDNLHRTIPFITRYEKARILGERAKQLSFPNIQSTIEVPSDVIDSYEIAKLEYESNKIPFIIRRILPNGDCEYWKFQDLEKILFN